MLEPYIIEDLKRREAEVRRENDRPQLELPLPDHRPATERRRPEDEPDERPDGGVIIIDL
jgi:hypothetical protein